MLHSINLSLASTCGANCLYCPTNRWKNIKNKIMSLETAENIIDQVSEKSFLEKHNTSRFEVWENGDGFMNPNIIKIMEYIKEKIPNVEIEIYTNFQNFTPEKIEYILDNNLLDSIVCNVDWSNPSQYMAVKWMDFYKVINNIKYFIEYRNKIWSNLWLNIQVLTQRHFVETIYKNFWFYPKKFTWNNYENLIDDFEDTKKMLEKFINPKLDKVYRSTVFWWSERDSFENIDEINHTDFICPCLDRTEEAFITPEWNWYFCPQDANNELMLWNVIEEWIDKIYESKERKELIVAVHRRKFKNINWPCKTINCCVNLCK